MRRGITVVGFLAASALLIAGSVSRLATYVAASLLLTVAMVAWRVLTGEGLSFLTRAPTPKQQSSVTPDPNAPTESIEVDAQASPPVAVVPQRPSSVRLVRDEPPVQLAPELTTFTKPGGTQPWSEPLDAPAVTPLTPTVTEHDLFAAISELEQLPIEHYDTMTVAQILPALRGLGVEELELIELHERRGRNRSTVLKRIDELCGFH